jgi:hypothetical protein
MQAIYETGYVRNLANFDSLISKIVGYGVQYKPSKSTIQLDSLESISQNAKLAIANFNNLTLICQNTVAIRELAFNSLYELSKYLFDTLKSATTISETETYMLVGSNKTIHKGFPSQQDYDDLLKVFYKIIELLKAMPQYSPERSELQINYLHNFYVSLNAKNEEVKRNNNLLNNASLILNEIMYRESIGLVDITFSVKMYLKIAFGCKSNEYQQIAILKMNKMR